MPDKNIAEQIKTWGQELGFQQVGITDIELSQAETRLKDWLAQNFHGEMTYMANHGSKRTHPEQLTPGTIRVISARMDYLPTMNNKTLLKQPEKAYIARYCLGRDYHKLIRKRLKKLAEKIKQTFPQHQYRVFTDSAPVMEKPLAEKAGLGWQGKHTVVINKHAGSLFFLGTIYTNIPLPIDKPVENNCGTCKACINICPTKAIVAPYKLDARKCISYLTIEYKGSIPEELRKPMGNRIFGCDDCQLICPWNRYAKLTDEKGFQAKHNLNNSDLVDLFNWTETEFLEKTRGSAIRRATYDGWLRNIAVALGNAPTTAEIINTLTEKQQHKSALVREHVAWALAQHK